MRIAVVGLGGVGGYIAANLTKTTHKVVGFARGEHLQKIKENGIKVIEDTKEWSVSLDAKTLEEADGYFDIVLLCVKSYDLKSSYEAVKEYIDSKSIILSLSNGVEHGDELREWSDAIVLDACVYILSHIERAGVIRKKGKVFALVFGGDRKAKRVLEPIFDEASLRIKMPQEIETAIWKKYIFISAFATLTSYYNESIAYIYKHYYDEAKETLKEIANVADAKGIVIFDEVQKALDIAKGLPYDASTSMHLDFKNKKRDELNTLSGYIVTQAKNLEVEVPNMQKMYRELLKKHR